MTKGIRRIKRGIAVLLSACMILGMTPIQARAEEAGTSVSGSDAQTGGSASGNESSRVYELTEKDGEYYDDQHVKYTLSTDGSNTATVAGYDTSYVNDTNFSADEVEAGKGWEITIPAKVSFDGTEYVVTEVEDRAFRGCIRLTGVEFTADSSIMILGGQCFRECSFEEIILPESLTRIDIYAFQKNTKLKSINIPKNVSYLGSGICYGCTALTEITVDPENTKYNVNLGKGYNCIIDNETLVQGCSTSVIPDRIYYIGVAAFAGIDIENVDFSNHKGPITLDTFAFEEAVLPEDWKMPEFDLNGMGEFALCTSLKNLTFPDSNIYIRYTSTKSPTFIKCNNFEKVVIPSTINIDRDYKNLQKDIFRGCESSNLTVYVEKGAGNSIMSVLRPYAKEDWTDGKTTPDKNADGNYILRDAYRVQFAQDYVGYTLTKAKGCTTLTPIPGDSVRFVINVADNYKKNVTVYATDDSGKKTELTKDADGVYTLNNVNENNYKISLENYGECKHENTTYTPGTDESGNSIITRVCDDCGYKETGKVTATWRHGDSIAFYCDNASIKGTYAVTEAVEAGKSTYSYEFTPIDGTCTGNGSVTVTEKTEEKVSKTSNGITYSTVESENDITNPLGNCTADIYYDSESAALYINGPETYVVSGTTTADRIVVNNTKPTTLVLNGLDIQMTALPAIDLQGTADVKIVLADKTDNVLKSGGDYAALQKNDLAKDTPKLSINGPGSLTASTTGAGAGIGAQSKKAASNITFHNAIINASSDMGCGIGDGSGTQKKDSDFSADDYIINGGIVAAESENLWDVSGGVTVDEGATVRGISLYYYDNFESITTVKKGFICRRSRLLGKSYCKMVGDAMADFQFNGDGLEIPENTTLTLGYNGQIFTNNGTVTNNGTFILKGYMRDLDSVTNNGTIYNYCRYGDSLKDKVSGTGTLHEDIDHDGLCEICEAHEDIGNVNVTCNKDVTVMKGDTLTLSAVVEPKESGTGKEVTYQWYQQLGADGSYTKISDATTAEYVQENCSLDVGTYTYRLQALCDGIVRYIPFTVTVKQSLSSLIEKAESIVSVTDNKYSKETLEQLNNALAKAKGLSASSSKEEKWNAYNELEAALNAMKNAHTIVRISSNPANSGILDGGGKYEIGDKIILKAQAVDGFVFVGWYDTEQITESDKPLSTDTTYTYGTVEEKTPSEISLYAVYKSNENRHLSITVGNGTVAYSYQNGAQTGTWNNSFTNNEFAKGSYFTLTAEPSDGYTFLYWVNQDGRVLTDSLTYSFYLGDNMELKACYKTTESSEAESQYVIFKDMSGRILWSGDVPMNQETDGTKYGTVTAPEHGTFTGYTFKQWKDASGNVMTVDDSGYIKITEAVTIYAEYEAESGLTLTVDGVQREKTYSYGSLVTVTADESKDNKYFSGWYIGDKLVSDKKAYSFYITGNTEITAKYEGDDVITRQPLVNMTMSDRTTLTDGKQSVVMNVTWSIPEGYEIIEAGLVRTLEDAYSDQLELDKVDKTNVKKNPSKLTTAGGTMTYTLTLGAVSAKKNLYARGYLTYRNVASGEVITVYTDTFTSNVYNN